MLKNVKEICLGMLITAIAVANAIYDFSWMNTFMLIKFSWYEGLIGVIVASTIILIETAIYAILLVWLYKTIKERFEAKRQKDIIK